MMASKRIQPSSTDETAATANNALNSKRYVKPGSTQSRSSKQQQEEQRTKAITRSASASSSIGKNKSMKSILKNADVPSSTTSSRKQVKIQTRRSSMPHVSHSEQGNNNSIGKNKMQRRSSMPTMEQRQEPNSVAVKPKPKVHARVRRVPSNNAITRSNSTSNSSARVSDERERQQRRNSCNGGVTTTTAARPSLLQPQLSHRISQLHKQHSNRSLRLGDSSSTISSFSSNNSHNEHPIIFSTTTPATRDSTNTSSRRASLLQPELSKRISQLHQNKEDIVRRRSTLKMGNHDETILDDVVPKRNSSSIMNHTFNSSRSIRDVSNSRTHHHPIGVHGRKIKIQAKVRVSH